MKRNWGNERTRPDYEIPKHEKVYKSMLESCMMLDNNKKIHEDVKHEMTAHYKEKLDKILRETRPGLWMSQRMPKIKQAPSLNLQKRMNLDEEDSPQKAEVKNQGSKLQVKLVNAINENNIESRDQSEAGTLEDTRDS